MEREIENVKLKNMSDAPLEVDENPQLQEKAFFTEDELTAVGFNVEVEEDVGSKDFPLNIGYIKKSIDEANQSNLENVLKNIADALLEDDKKQQLKKIITYITDDEFNPVDLDVPCGTSLNFSPTNSCIVRLVKKENQREMENLKLKNFADALLAGDENQQFHEKAHFAEDELTPVDINVNVKSVGSLLFPLTNNCIEKLVSVSSKAKLSRKRKQAFLNENICNTYQIIREKLCVTIEQSSLTRVLNKIHDEFGLDENSVLSLHLHNMLIYKHGPIFDMQQEKENIDNMIATLLIVLPSAHIGGDLIIHQGQKKHVFTTENIDEKNAKCIAFYANCTHEIEKVKQGHRVALAYKLLLNASESVSYEISNHRLKTAMQDYFCEPLKECQKLVYFLNREYTEHGLKWGLLKGNDRTNAMSILKVAKTLELVPHLALVNISETFSTSGCYNENTKELLESNITLSDWVSELYKKLPYGNLCVDKSDICWTKDTNSFEPYKTEYKRYKGDSRGSKVFWYRRAAVVLWAESSQITMNFMLNHCNAINGLCKLTNVPGNEKQVSEIIQKARRYFIYDKEVYFERLVNIAVYLQDKSEAFSILSSFSRDILHRGNAESLVKLQNRYGIPWCIDILNKWKSNSVLNAETVTGLDGKPRKCAPDSVWNIKEIDYFIKIFMEYKGAVQIAEFLLDEQVIQRDDCCYVDYRYFGIYRNHNFAKLHEIFSACAVIQNVSILHKVIECVIANPKKYPFVTLIDLYLKLKNEVSPEYFSNFNLLKNYLVTALDGELAQGELHDQTVTGLDGRPRTCALDDDWSMKWIVMSCDCELCSEALRFLNSPTEVVKRWPLREDLRTHVIYHLVSSLIKCPLDISVDDSGSPFKLIIEKKEWIHEECNERYQKLKLYQAALHA